MQYDPTVIAATASETDWTTFREVLAETNALARRAEAPRNPSRRSPDAGGDQTLFDATNPTADGPQGAPVAPTVRNAAHTVGTVAG